MARPKHATVWTPDMDAVLGQMPDALVGKVFGFSEATASVRRRALGVPTYRSTRAPQPVPCANCGEITTRPLKAQKRSRKIYCSRPCADAGQKTRDSETLRYGPGWKNRRAEARKRETTCRACGKTPEENGAPLHVHHLKPFRFGGTNLPTNLACLCDPCHHRIEWETTQVLSSILIDVTLVGSSLTISVDGLQRWPMSARGAESPTAIG